MLRGSKVLTHQKVLLVSINEQIHYIRLIGSFRSNSSQIYFYARIVQRRIKIIFISQKFLQLSYARVCFEIIKGRSAIILQKIKIVFFTSS